MMIGGVKQGVAELDTANSTSITASAKTGRPALVRFAAAVWLLVYAAMLVAIPMLDAWSGHVERSETHWQDASETSGAPLHDPAVCQVCQQMGLGGQLSQCGPLLPFVDAGATKPGLNRHLPPRRAFSFLRLRTRAPPIV